MSVTSPLTLDRLERDLPDLAASYRTAAPYPHIVLDDVIAPDLLVAAVHEHTAIPDHAWRAYIHVNERKYAHQRPEEWGPALRTLADALNADRFVHLLEGLTGIEGLRPDPSLDGSGLHRSERGGFLNVHTDFTVHHADPTLRRRVNLLLYLNPLWDPEWGGALELWSSDMGRCVTSIEPRANRMVLFSTTETAYHGHPDPLRCPPDVARRSLALYYFTVEPHTRVRSTHYRARPGDGVRRVGISLDTQVLRAYDRVKRRLHLSDSTVTRLLRSFGRRR